MKFEARNLGLPTFFLIFVQVKPILPIENQTKNNLTFMIQILNVVYSV